MKIKKVIPQSDFQLHIFTENGEEGIFDTKPYLHYEAFMELREGNNFQKVTNGIYFIEWECGADLSSDTIEAKWRKK